jgi:hypothetical protein
MDDQAASAGSAKLPVISWFACEPGPSFCPLGSPIKVNLTFRSLVPLDDVALAAAVVVDSTRPGDLSARTLSLEKSSFKYEHGDVAADGSLDFHVSAAFDGPAIASCKPPIPYTTLNNVASLVITVAGTRSGTGVQITESLECVVQVAPGTAAGGELQRVILSPF